MATILKQTNKKQQETEKGERTERGRDTETEGQRQRKGACKEKGKEEEARSKQPQIETSIPKQNKPPPPSIPQYHQSNVIKQREDHLWSQTTKCCFNVGDCSGYITILQSRDCVLAMLGGLILSTKCIYIV